MAFDLLANNTMRFGTDQFTLPEVTDEEDDEIILFDNVTGGNTDYYVSTNQLAMNTMRFGTDRFGNSLLFDYVEPSLNIYINGLALSLELTENKISSPAVAIRVNDKIFYTWLVSPESSTASPVRVKINDVVYAFAYAI